VNAGSPSPPSTPPPPPKPKNTRRHPRLELYASVELHAAEQPLVLPARNISLGGVFLSADGHDLSMVEVGTTLEVMVFDALDEKRSALRIAAEVVRRDDDGVALMWAESDPAMAGELGKLLQRLQPRKTKSK